MDPIIAGVAILSCVVVIPVLLATLTVQTYLYALGLIVVPSITYLWLIEKFAPARSPSRAETGLGLLQVHPPPQNSTNQHSASGPRTTLVFVHGLGANPSTTWKFDDGTTSCNWITELLSHDLKGDYPTSDVHFCMFNYESFWFRNSNMRLRDTALSLLQELRQITGTFILVGHSYGGIVIKKTLVMFPDLKKYVRGIVFLGTPHQGTSFNRYGLIASFILAPLDPDIEIMRLLAPDSSGLEDLQRDFERDFGTTSRKYFFETNKMERKLLGYIPILREYVVTKRSATHGANEIDTIKLDTDHRGLNKFSDRDSNYKLVARALFAMLPHTYSISASEFTCLDIDTPDADYPGRRLWYIEKLGANNYPDGVRVELEHATGNARPVGDTILTCRRTANALLRHRRTHVDPGQYKVLWLFWCWGGRNYPKSHEATPVGFVPDPDQLPENSICERYFPSTVRGEGPPKVDSSFFFPWDVHCSAGRPQDPAGFLGRSINPRSEGIPLAAPALLKPGYGDIQFEPGYWRTMKNSGWYRVEGPVFEVGEDGEVAFVIGNKFVPQWIGGFSFGGVILEPVT